MIRILLMLAVVALAAPLAACGKKGPPVAPGPPDELIYPKTYPTH